MEGNGYFWKILGPNSSLHKCLWSGKSWNSLMSMMRSTSEVITNYLVSNICSFPWAVWMRQKHLKNLAFWVKFCFMWKVNQNLGTVVSEEKMTNSIFLVNIFNMQYKLIIIFNSIGCNILKTILWCEIEYFYSSISNFVWVCTKIGNISTFYRVKLGIFQRNDIFYPSPLPSRHFSLDGNPNIFPQVHDFLFVGKMYQ